MAADCSRPPPRAQLSLVARLRYDNRFMMTIPPCPASANCISTEATDPRHAAAPFILARTTNSWPQIRAAVFALPRTRMIEEGDFFVCVECRTVFFRFVDDLVVQMRADRGDLVVRSASRLGHYDFGVNRRRVETLRRHLEASGVIRFSA